MQITRPGRFQSVRFKLMIVYILLILVAMQLFGAYFIQSINRYFIENYSRTIAHEAVFLSNFASASLGSGNTSTIEKQIGQYIRPFSELASSSVYVLDKNGNVVGTSANPFLIGQKRVDFEVTRALLGVQTDRIALDPRTGERQLYLAVPVQYKGQVVGAVEFVSPLGTVYHSISRIIIIFATGTLLALGLTALLAIIIARTITGPISAITRTARALAGGDFNQSVTIHSNDEIGELASTFNMLTRRLREAIASTEREKSRLQAIMSTMSDGVIATNLADDILMINPAASQLLHCSLHVLGYKLSVLLPGQFVPGDVQVVQANDKLIAVAVTSLGNDRATTGGRVLVMRDVTEELRLEEARKRFVADVSHELRTPITTIKTYVEALLEGAHSDEELSLRFLHVMDRETNRMIRLIRDLLQLSRFDAGYEVLHRERMTLSQLVNSLADRFALVAFQSDLQYETEVVADGNISVDRDRIDQVLDNIASNALKHTPERGSIRVRAGTQREDGLAWVEIADTGQGIPAAELPHIFERFYRVDKARSRQHGGTGLGLAIAQEIVRAHGGQITATSEIGHGTTVRISLPLVEEGAL
ncbi:MAG: ATP-binding protein [Firmicutes bacterium]|nr:ATP-binding protein [Bacillota bacterium]